MFFFLYVFFSEDESVVSVWSPAPLILSDQKAYIIIPNKKELGNSKKRERGGVVEKWALRKRKTKKIRWKKKKINIQRWEREKEWMREREGGGYQETISKKF